MDRKAVARETMEIMKNGYYLVPAGKDAGTEKTGTRQEPIRIDIQKAMEHSISESVLITPEKGEELLKQFKGAGGQKSDLVQRVENMPTVEAIRKLAAEGKSPVGVLNFASAKNPGGGFLNGAMAQEESLAASSTLYRTLIAHEEYYKANRAQRSMMYTDYGIYSPEVTFFRDGAFRLSDRPAKAGVLTLPAVNMGQVIQKGEDAGLARQVMKRRMKLALAVFAWQGAKHLVLGAYGCGVFRNDPKLIARWWQEILEEGMAAYFDTILYAVLDRNEDGNCIRAFRETI